MKISKAAFVYMREGTKSHKESILKIKKILSQEGIPFKMLLRDTLKPGMLNGYGLVVVGGGDGTFLRASHSVKNETPMLGVNTDPTSKEGFFMRSNCRNFSSKIKALKKGTAKIVSIPRVQAFGKGIKLPIALNEIFIGDLRPYRMSYYTIKIGNFKEYHRSSGLIVAGPAGSHAWAHSAGCKKLKMTERKMIVVAREPYNRKLNNQKLKAKVLPSGAKIEIISDMRHGIAVSDTISKPRAFPRGKRATLMLSKHDLRIVL